MKNFKGFTIIELVMVVVILGILAFVTIPEFMNLKKDANMTSEDGVVKAVHVGLKDYFNDAEKGKRKDYPKSLDSLADKTACSRTAACFDHVIPKGGVTGQWEKINSSTYLGPAGNMYVYDSQKGSFQKK